jgi:hypothetical protein
VTKQSDDDIIYITHLGKGSAVAQSVQRHLSPQQQKGIGVWIYRCISVYVCVCVCVCLCACKVLYSRLIVCGERRNQVKLDLVQCDVVYAHIVNK